MDQELKQHIISLSERYETADFLPADPSSFMHKVKGEANQEAMAFIASCLSYGSRKQFFPKIQYLLDAAQGEVDRWVRTGAFANDIADNPVCYYRPPPHAPAAHGLQPHVAGARKHERVCAAERHHWP